MMWLNLFKRFFRFQEMILLFSLSTMACLPLALSGIVRDASLSLLLPITLLGMLLASALAKRPKHKLSSEIILLFLGPLGLFIRIGQMSGALIELIKQTFNFIPPLYNWLRFDTPADPTLFVQSIDDLNQRGFVLVSRLSIWVTGLISKTQVEDPVARTLVWSLCLWLIAIWAGWQIYRHNRLLAGVLPSTILLAFVLDYTGKEGEILWFHLALLLFLIGLNSYVNTQSHWDNSNIDYADSTSIDTLSLVGMLTLTLVVFSFLSSTISIKDILRDLRERRAANTARAETFGLDPAKEARRTVRGSYDGLPRSHLIGAGPELSDQLVMTISTGDLPAMPINAQVPVPYYRWRTVTYQIYTGSGWANPTKPADEIKADQSLFKPSDSNIRIVHQQVNFSNEVDGRIFWTGTLLSANIPFQAVWNHKAETTPPNNPRLDSDLLAALAPVQSYQADSMLLNISANDLRNSPSVYPDWVKNQYLLLPDAVPERVLALARDLTAAKSNPYDRAVAIQDYLRKFPYTLDVTAPPAGRDVADYFLFDLKQGYCDYYATTMVVLARAAGLPARLVIGYANGSYNYEHAEYVVTENYAHSWVEVYFANIGWVEFEPTASQPAITHVEEVETPTPVQPLPVKQPFGKQILILANRIVAGLWLPAIILFILACVWLGWDTLHINRLEPAQAIELLFKRLRRLARPISGILPLEQTANQYAFNLAKKISALQIPPRAQRLLSPAIHEIDQLTELYSRSLFSPTLPTNIEIQTAVKTWSHLRWRLILANMLTIKSSRASLYKKLV